MREETAVASIVTGGLALLFGALLSWTCVHPDGVFDGQRAMCAEQCGENFRIDDDHCTCLVPVEVGP